MANPRSKISKADELKLRAEYELGQYQTLTELAEKYGLNKQNLDFRIRRYSWNQSRDERNRRTLSKIDKLSDDEAKRWTDKVKQRTEKDWELIDKSIDSIAGSEGEVDPDTMLTSARARKLLDDMHRRSLGMLEPAQLLDIQSKGQSIGESLVSAIAKLRDSKSAVSVTMEQADQLAEYEIVKTVNGKPVS